MSPVTADREQSRDRCRFIGLQRSRSVAISFPPAWFIGFARGLVTGIWVGNNDNSPVDGVAGGTLPATAWRRFNLQSAGMTHGG
jgi:membrane peptidoglycan carboxypeptidase